SGGGEPAIGWTFTGGWEPSRRNNAAKGAGHAAWPCRRNSAPRAFGLRRTYLAVAIGSPPVTGPTNSWSAARIAGPFFPRAAARHRDCARGRSDARGGRHRVLPDPA